MQETAYQGDEGHQRRAHPTSAAATLDMADIQRRWVGCLGQTRANQNPVGFWGVVWQGTGKRRGVRARSRPPKEKPIACLAPPSLSAHPPHYAVVDLQFGSAAICGRRAARGHSEAGGWRGSAHGVGASVGGPRAGHTQALDRVHAATAGGRAPPFRLVARARHRPARGRRAGSGTRRVAPRGSAGTSRRRPRAAVLCGPGRGARSQRARAGRRLRCGRCCCAPRRCRTCYRRFLRLLLLLLRVRVCATLRVGRRHRGARRSYAPGRGGECDVAAVGAASYLSAHRAPDVACRGSPPRGPLQCL